MKKLILFILFSTIILRSFATHNRAGEITYKHISGYTYKITVTTYTKESSIGADKCFLTIYFGDSDTQVVNRINGPKTNLCGNNIGSGESLQNDIKKNIYETIHTYPGPGTYVITMEDPNRNANICNFSAQSILISFFLRSVLQINAFLPPNSSPVLLNPPIDNGCVGECFYHNPSAFDAEGDSLSYKLIPCYGDGRPIPSFQLPAGMTYQSLNPVTGDLNWCVPQQVCQYNIAILIEEWKLLPGTKDRYFAGSILRDMQIDIGACNNHSPIINPINDTCITAGTTLKFNVTASDPDKNLLKLSATGGSFELSPKATFTSTPAIQNVTGTFSWTPNCSQIQLLPYQVTFKVTDTLVATPLANFRSVFIKVVPPGPLNVTAMPSGVNMNIKWDHALCHDTIGSKRLTGYEVYRIDSCSQWKHNPCEIGVPDYTGYKLIGTTDYLTTHFTDTNNGLGLAQGKSYSYIVIALYVDGSKSFASANACAHLVRDVPIITNVSVLQTDAVNGKIWIHWVKPLGTSPNLDTIASPPPYEFKLLQSTGFNGAAFNPIFSYTYTSYAQITDTGFVSTGLNTADTAYSYRVEFYSNGILKGSTTVASSVFLKTEPADKAMTLTWQTEVPWHNYKFIIQRETLPGSGIFNSIDTITTPTYTDRNLINNALYCYKVITIGNYSDTSLPKPLFNASQIRCDKPIDNTPPCQPPLTITSPCETETATLNWINPNTFCSNDAVKYNLYYAHNTSDDTILKIIAVITDINQTSYTYVNTDYGVKSIAGCYAVTAIDSTGNESPIVNKYCIDNCPYYELPNVFTPNNDNVNDLFKPLPNYRYVKDIDLRIFDRWGLEMFKTTDPAIMWDGTNSNTKQACSSGTYYYLGTINEIRLEGIVPKQVHGFIELIHDNSKQAR